MWHFMRFVLTLLMSAPAFPHTHSAESTVIFINWYIFFCIALHTTLPNYIPYQASADKKKIKLVALVLHCFYSMLFVALRLNCQTKPEFYFKFFLFVIRPSWYQISSLFPHIKQYVDYHWTQSVLWSRWRSVLFWDAQSLHALLCSAASQLLNIISVMSSNCSILILSQLDFYCSYLCAPKHLWINFAPSCFLVCLWCDCF